MRFIAVPGTLVHEEDDGCTGTTKGGLPRDEREGGTFAVCYHEERFLVDDEGKQSQLLVVCRTIQRHPSFCPLPLAY